MYGTEVVAKVEHKIVERVEIQTVKKVEGKVLQPVRHKGEKPVIGKAVTQLKEVQLEEAHVVEQSPYEKLQFPQRFGEAQVEVWRFGQANMTKAMEMGRPRTETEDKVSPQ
ncbi:hypothetical protein F2Q69_00041169 [Brassica cretica]|uniref:Uncharacterized protein n=1 Tax=Brassica cretica TaxID=69181 RepID=A0A8S9NG94_BRACR|nr:hypothetical protein F2Q69_00041169 [Brassica cretica]